MPLTRTHSIGNPFAGTSRDSMLAGTPSHTTATPRSRSTFATASAGNTWPPVPPAMMRTGRAKAVTRAHRGPPGMRITAEREVHLTSW